MGKRGKNTAGAQSSLSSRTHLSRKAAFTGRYQVSSSKGGYKRNNNAFKDPDDPLKILKSQIFKSPKKIRKLKFVFAARANFKRKPMGDKVTKAMRERAESIPTSEQTTESLRMLNYPNHSLQALGVERNHINANSQVATQTTAFLSAMLLAESEKQQEIGILYQDFAMAHGLSKKIAQELSEDLTRMPSLIDEKSNESGKQRVAEQFISKHTTIIADQSENLRFGRSQHMPKPFLHIIVQDHPQLASNQDVGSFWDGNRTPGGSLTPRSQQIFNVIHRAEKAGIFPPGMADAATTRPVKKSTNERIGSLRQIGPIPK